jgi:DNA recombination-dependent growth factor C
MGLIYGTGSFTRFTVEEDLPEDHMETFPRQISRYAFRNLDENTDVERSAGWVNILDMFDSRFSGMEYFKDPCIALSWRVDARNVPAKALLQHTREQEGKIKDAEGLEHLSKRQREEIREGVRIRLMKRAIPRSNVYDMIWNTGARVVIFGATGNKLCDEFAEFFLRCFGLHLKTVFPLSMASEILEAEGRDSGFLEGQEYSIIREVG